MYYPKKSYNGVLFFLRESHKSEEDKRLTVEKITEKSDRWTDKMLHNSFTDAYWMNEVKDAKKRRISKIAATKYHNRFCEALTYVGMGDKDLPDSAYDNLYKLGGGASNSKEYRSFLKNYTDTDFENLLKSLDYKTGYIFTCRDIYAKLKLIISRKPDVFKKQYETDGIRYKNDKYKLKSFSCTDSKGNKLIVFEMLHPCRGYSIERA